MDWLKFYGLKGEPFGAQPLRWPDEFQNVFVLTEIIKTEVDPVISTIVDSERYLYLISGERGAGKSTLLHYITWISAHLVTMFQMIQFSHAEDFISISQPSNLSDTLQNKGAAYRINLYKIEFIP